MKKCNTHEKAQEIIKLFIDNEITLFQQLQILKMVLERVEWCRKTGAEMKQEKLKL
jgi:hypothetical protein